MPVGAVRRGRGRGGSHDLRERGAAFRVPEADLVAAEVDLEGHVVPDLGLPLRLPLGVLRDHELQIRVISARLAGDPAVLHLDEVALEEADLVLAVLRRRVGVLAHHAEVVEHLAAVDSRFRLRDQLGAPHVLAVPEGRAVERELGALLRHRVGRVLVAGRQVDVFLDGPAPVDVVLVVSDLVAPAPLVQVRRRRHIVEPSVP